MRHACVISLALLLALTCGCRRNEAQERQKAEQTSSDAPIVVEQSEEATETPVPDPSTFAGMLASGQVSSIRVIGDSITAGFRLE